jgi:ferredoxin
VIDGEGLDALISQLRSEGRRTIGPVVRHGAVVHAELSGGEDLPRGWRDRQEPGRYRLEHDEGEQLFGWAVGPESLKREFFVPEESVWRSSVVDGQVVFSEPALPAGSLAIVGARPCELRALEVLDHVLQDGEVADDRYAARRGDAVVVAAECGAPADTCFCSSMGTGPSAELAYDLALTEFLEGGHRFYVQVGSEVGAALLAQIPHRAATDEDDLERNRVLEAAVSRMHRTLDTDGLPELLARNLEHPRWEEVAERCLSCGNCTLVCPTCFCSDIKDVTDLSGSVERQRRWASCFDLDHSLLHGGPVRPDTASRYRQWLTHKLSTWWDQFGELGCVGCGRCITWCPVGIDLTEEAGAIRVSDGARRHEEQPT